MSDQIITPTAESTVILKEVSNLQQSGALAPWYVKLGITIYLITLIWLIMQAVLRLWVGETSWVLDGLAATTAMLSNAKVVSFLFAMIGGALGAIILSVLFFFRHASVLNDFRAPHAWGYLLSPWVGAVLGCVVFALVQGGLLVFAAGSSPKDAEVANLGYFGLGFLVGFGWQRFTMKLRQMAESVLSGAGERSQPRSQVRTDNVAPGAGGSGSS